jgi:hypothetical protein
MPQLLLDDSGVLPTFPDYCPVPEMKFAWSRLRLSASQFPPRLCEVADNVFSRPMTERRSNPWINKGRLSRLRPQLSGTGGYAKLVNFVILVLTVLAVAFELYQWVVTGFVSFSVLALVVVLAIIAFVTINKIQSLRAFAKWAKAHRVGLLTGVHPNTEARLASEIQSARKEVFDKMEARLAEHLQKVDEDVKRQIQVILGSVKHVVEPVYVNKSWSLPKEGTATLRSMLMSIRRLT